MKVRFILLALLAMACVSACGPKEKAPVKKDMCIQMYSARSLITPENYPDILKEMAAMGYTATTATKASSTVTPPKPSRRRWKPPA